MDWRKREEIACSRLFAHELIKRLLPPYDWCETCRPGALALDSIKRLSAPPEFNPDTHPGTISGRVSASKPNLTNLPRFFGTTVKNLKLISTNTIHVDWRKRTS